MEVIVIQHVGCEPLGAIEAAFSKAGLNPRCFLSSVDNPPPGQIGSARGLVVLGGPMSVYEQDKYPFITAELALIRSAVSANVPVLGVCLGAQLLAAALGAAVEPGPQSEIGWYAVELTAMAAADPLWRGMPARFVGFHWHGDVFDLPAGAVRLASSAITPNQAFRYGRDTYGFQFHLEVDEHIIESWMDEYGQVNGEAIRVGIPDFLPAMQEVAHEVFGRWADLVVQNAR